MFRRKSSSPSCSPAPGTSSSDGHQSPGISLTTPSPEPGVVGQSSSKLLPPPALDYNPISDYYHFGKLIASAGPELAWKIYDANKKDDGQEAAVFFFDKRWAEQRMKPKRREQIVEVLTRGIINLEKYSSSNTRLLQILTPLQETEDTLAFATEPILGSLANVLGYLEDRLRQGVPSSLRLITFTDSETCQGISNISEALEQLHYDQKVIHRNLCPQSVIITKSGIWKLTGLEFMEKQSSTANPSSCDIDNVLPVSCLSYTSKLPKMCQPDLDYVAPEMQSSGAVSPQSDMFSLGILICSIFNNGRSPIEANFSTATYFKSLENLSTNINDILERMPNQLSKHVSSLLEPAPRKRPTSEHFVLIPYFREYPRNPVKFKLSIEAPSPACPWLMDDVHSSFKRSSLGDTSSSTATSTTKLYDPASSKLVAILSSNALNNNNSSSLTTNCSGSMTPRRSSTASLLMAANSVDSSPDTEPDNVTAAFLAVMDQSNSLNQRRHSDNSIIPLSKSPSNSTAPSPNNQLYQRSHSPSLTPFNLSGLNHARSTSSLIPPSRGRRHSSINPHDISRFATKLVDSAAEKVHDSVETATKATTSGMHLGIDTLPGVAASLSPLPSPTMGRRGSRRCSVADIAEMIVPVGLAPSSAVTSGSSTKSSKSPKPSKKMFKKLGNEMSNLLLKK